MENLLNCRMQYFVYKTCSPSWRLEKHIFPIHGVALIWEGSARYVLNGQVFQAQAGDLVYFEPGCSREATTEGMTIVALDFIVTQGSFHLPTLSQFAQSDELERLIREFEYEWLQSTPGRDLKCGALFLLILHTILHTKEINNSNYHVETIKRYIVDHYTEPIQVSELAELVGLNSVYCGTLFRKNQGMTLAEYTNRIRVRKAADLLEEGEHAITEIAYMCGFNDVYYFSRTFKRIMGYSPSKYKTRSSSIIFSNLKD